METGPGAETTPKGAELTNGPPGSGPPAAAGQCALYTFQARRTPMSAPALSSFPNCLSAPVSRIGQSLPQDILGRNSAGETHSKKHFQSVNVKGKEKL